MSAPSTDEVREAYQATGEGLDSKQRFFERGGEFDAWLDVVKAEAKAEALEDVDNYVDEVMFHSDEETNTGPLVAGRGPLISLLRKHAAALRTGAGAKQDAEEPVA